MTSAKLLCSSSLRCSLVAFVVCALSSFTGSQGAADIVDSTLFRPSYFTLEVQSTRSADRPRIVTTWAHVQSAGESYRALMPSTLVGGPYTKVDFRWAPGAAVAGESEKVELQWRWAGASGWTTQLLGEGFRDPSSGHLIILPAFLSWNGGRSGHVEMRFLVHDVEGVVRQDGGLDSVVSLQVASRSNLPVLQFSDDWKTRQQGELFAGEAFEIEYSMRRMANQFNFSAAADSNWCLYAKVQFDDGPVQSYPLLASHREHPEKRVGLIPTVQIPLNARRVSIWFFALHNTNSYFDSRFGQNYQFVIKQR